MNDEQPATPQPAAAREALANAILAIPNDTQATAMPMSRGYHMGWNRALREAAKLVAATPQQPAAASAGALTKVATAALAACDRVIHQDGGILGGIDFHALGKSLRAALQSPPYLDKYVPFADTPTPKAQVGTWILIAPNGREFMAASPMKCCQAEQRERVPAEVALGRIARSMNEDHGVDSGPTPVATAQQSEAITWPKEKSVKRRDDMSPSDALQVGIDESGDLQVSLWTEKAGYSSVEFCAPGSGGGRSPATRRALIALMVAMEKDNGPTIPAHPAAGEATERDSTQSTEPKKSHE